MQESPLEIGVVSLPIDEEERVRLLGEDAEQMRGGLYRAFVMRDSSGNIIGDSITLVRALNGNGYDVLENVPTQKLANANVAINYRDGVQANPLTGEVTLSSAVERAAEIELRHALEDMVVPGLSLVDRVGEIARMAHKDGPERIEGVYLGKDSDGHAIIEQADHGLVALPVEESSELSPSQLDKRVTIEPPTPMSEKAEHGYELGEIAIEGMEIVD